MICDAGAGTEAGTWSSRQREQLRVRWLGKVAYTDGLALQRGLW